MTIYPYLLRGLSIDRPNQVWITDITDIRMQHGFLYLCAILDWATRKVLAWRLSNTLTSDFCTAALRSSTPTRAAQRLMRLCCKPIKNLAYSRLLDRRNAEGRFSLMDCLDEIDDPRAASNGTLYDFREVLVIAICASLCDMDTCEDFALWARARQAWLIRFLTLKNGTPSSATLYRLFRALDLKQFDAFFRRWVSQIVPAAAAPGQMVIDGKTIRGSAGSTQRAAHMVSAFSTELGIVFGQERVDQKSTLRASWSALMPWGARRDIARKIIDKGGDYLLMVKGNQPGLLTQVSEAFMTAQRESMPRHEHIEKSHGRLVTQITWTVPADQYAQPRHNPA